MACPKLQLNRLARWAAIRIGTLAIDGGFVGAVASAEEAHAVQLELDISSAAEWKDSIPPESVLDVCEEMLDLADEIAAQGDVR